MYHRYERTSREAMREMQQQAALLRRARLARTPPVETGQRPGLRAALRRSRCVLAQAWQVWRHGLPRPASR